MCFTKKEITEFHYGKFSLFYACIFFIPSVFYFLGICIKNFLYYVKILKEKKVDAKVICVGNLTTGGVGKTPVVIELANYYSDLGKKIAVISRGYGGKLDNTKINLIKTGNKILIDDANLTGDEVNLISKKTKNVTVISCKDRVAAADFAVRNFQSEIIILDDGFSNRKLYKDVNIILIDCAKMFGNGYCLPMGPLREPVFELKRLKEGDFILFIDKSGEKNKHFNSFVSNLKIQNAICNMEIDKIYNIKTKEVLKADIKNVAAFSGIGQPVQFYNLLKPKYNLLFEKSFDDHVEYTQTMLDEIIKDANKNNAKCLITTEKDAVKLLKLENIENVYVLAIKPRINFSAIKL